MNETQHNTGCTQKGAKAFHIDILPQSLCSAEITLVQSSSTTSIGTCGLQCTDQPSCTASVDWSLLPTGVVKTNSTFFLCKQHKVQGKYSCVMHQGSPLCMQKCQPTVPSAAARPAWQRHGSGLLHANCALRHMAMPRNPKPSNGTFSLATPPPCVTQRLSARMHCAALAALSACMCTACGTRGKTSRGANFMIR